MLLQILYERTHFVGNLHAKAETVKELILLKEIPLRSFQFKNFL